MNYKELIIPVVLAFGITLAFNYFWGNRFGPGRQAGQIESGQMFLAPEQEQVYKPLKKEIDFIDKKSQRVPERTALETDRARFVFTNDGATLEHLEFKRTVDGKQRPLSTVLPTSRVNKEDRCFLVALNEKTPYYFDLINRDENSTSIMLTYKASFGDGIMRKRFIISKTSYQVDLEVTVEPKAGLVQPVQARIFFGSPSVPELAKTDVITGIVNKPGSTTTLEQKKPNDKMLREYYAAPTLFGFQDRYFIHSMVRDEQNFVKRAYFKQGSPSGLVGILEGPAVNNKTSWKVSFYFGPKEVPAMAAVDQRLEQTLEYGWFAIISKFLLSFMKWINQYTHNFGLAILLLTVLIKLLLIPLTMKGMQGLKKQQEFQKKMQYIQQRYKHDKDALNRERAELIRKHGMPGLGGCLPMFLQIPVFIALSRVLSTSIELYQAPFLWMSDLSVRDPYFILPVLAGVSLLFSAPTIDPKQKFSTLAFALVIGVVVANLPAGLAIYIFVQQLLTVWQNLIQKRLHS